MEQLAMKPPRRPRTRLKPEERKALILTAAARAIVDQGYLPLSLDVLAGSLEISKALIYAYYPTQFDLVNDLLRRNAPELAEALQAQIAPGADTRETLAACAGVYFDHVAANGPLMHILTTDLYVAGRRDAEIRRREVRPLRALARVLHRATGLGARRSLVAVRLLAALVEEAVNLAFRGVYPPQLCRSLFLELVGGGVDGLRAAATHGRSRSR